MHGYTSEPYGQGVRLIMDDVFVINIRFAGSRPRTTPVGFMIARSRRLATIPDAIAVDTSNSSKAALPQRKSSDMLVNETYHTNNLGLQGNGVEADSGSGVAVG